MFSLFYVVLYKIRSVSLSMLVIKRVINASVALAVAVSPMLSVSLHSFVFFACWIDEWNFL